MENSTAASYGNTWSARDRRFRPLQDSHPLARSIFQDATRPDSTRRSLDQNATTGRTHYVELGHEVHDLLIGLPDLLADGDPILWLLDHPLLQAMPILSCPHQLFGEAKRIRVQSPSRFHRFLLPSSGNGLLT